MKKKVGSSSSKMAAKRGFSVGLPQTQIAIGCLLEEMSSIYQPVERYHHSTVQVGDCLYMWGGVQPGLPRVHNNEKKKLMCSVVEVCHVSTGEWVQKPTTGDPPLGVSFYAAAVIRNEIFFFGGYCGHDKCYHNSLYSFNVDTFNWKELSPTTSYCGPWMKDGSGMIAIKVNGEDYLAVIGGCGLSFNNTPPQPGAQYSQDVNYQRCNEVHMYRLKSGEWTSPTVTGDRPVHISHFTLMSITNTTAIMFGGYFGDRRYSNDVYIFEFTVTSVKCTKFSNPGGSVQWPEVRRVHSSVLINCSSGPHLLVVGGYGRRYTNDCWLLNINKMEWKELVNIPDSVTNRQRHSLSVWNETQNTHWIIEFGGMRGSSTFSDTRFIEITSSTGDLVVQSVLDINEYQKRRMQDAVGKWMEEGGVDLTVTRVNMLGAPGAGKTCSQLLLLNEDPPTNDTSTPIACPAVRATRVAVCDKTIWNRVTRDKLLDRLAADLESASQEKKTKEPPLPVVFTLLDNTEPATEMRPDPSPTTQKKPDQVVSLQTKVIKEDKEYHTEAVVQEILATEPKGIRKSDHWLYVIDSGGQPAYQELLPLFTRAASLNIITLDLSKPFNERFDLMYRIDGQYFPCHSKSTQLAFFQSAVSTGASFKPLDISCISKKPTHSMHLKECVTKISPSTPEYYKFRDAMSLKITFKGKEDTLHLINCYTHIEVYFTGPTQHCPLVRKLLTTAIDNSSDAMHLKHNYVNAFACPSKRSSCYCIVRSSGDGNIVNCTVCPVSATISSDHWYWFESGPVESNNGTQTKQVNNQSLDKNLLLDKKPQKSDLVRLFKSSAAQYMLIGTALDVEVDDLLPNPQSTTKNLILVFNRWIDSDNDVTWRKVLQVCDDYPGQLGRVKAEVKEFLSSDRARGRSSQGQVVQLFEINFFMWMTM
uniref:Uncharacterized protein n=1 Tax=Amphimedon queenslandica TaxID=400682 RepID=A0A1X7TE71_AMPQE